MVIIHMYTQGVEKIMVTKIVTHINLTHLNGKTPEFFLLGLGYSIYK